MRLNLTKLRPGKIAERKNTRDSNNRSGCRISFKLLTIWLQCIFPPILLFRFHLNLLVIIDFHFQFIRKSAHCIHMSHIDVFLTSGFLKQHTMKKMENKYLHLKSFPVYESLGFLWFIRCWINTFTDKWLFVFHGFAFVYSNNNRRKKEENSAYFPFCQSLSFLSCTAVTVRKISWINFF